MKRPTAKIMLPLAALVVGAVIPWSSVAAVLHAGNVTIDGSACIGNDCNTDPPSPGYGFDTLRLMENNLRILAWDTSGGSFPTRDWQIEFNASSSGGSSYYMVRDCGNTAATTSTCNGTPQFTIEGGADNESIHVDSSGNQGGNVGFGTANPAVDLDVLSGNTPTLRLQQDNSSGFGVQSWDVAANEANWFVRDVTNGSALPLRIEPGVASNTLYLDNQERIGIGTSSPSSVLDIRQSGSIQISLTNANAGKASWKLTNNDNTENFRITVDGSGKQEFNLTKTGDLSLTGSLTVCSGGAASTSGTCAGAVTNLPDYVFSPDYRPMPLAELESYVRANRHLPGILSASDAATNGIDVTALQMGLLKNVEELALHTIQQQKTIDDMSSVLQLVPQASPPASAADGAIYVDGTDGATLCFRSGGAWIPLGGGGSCS